MSFTVTTENGLPAMSFERGDDLLTNVILSVEIGQGEFFLDPAFGLRRRRGLKNTPATARLVRGDFLAALQWLKDTGRATAIEVVMERATLQPRGWLQALITVTGAKGNVVTYEKFTEVV